jgi:hypothetical protein
METPPLPVAPDLAVARRLIVPVDADYPIVRDKTAHRSPPAEMR